MAVIECYRQYEVFPYVLPACAKNAIHRRDRVWFVAYSNGSKQRNDKGTNRGTTKEIWRQKKGNVLNEFCCNGIASDSELWGLKECGRETASGISNHNYQDGWSQVEPVLPRGDDGLSNWVDRVKGLGNAIVPQVAYEIFQAIEKYNSLPPPLQ